MGILRLGCAFWWAGFSGADSQSSAMADPLYAAGFSPWVRGQEYRPVAPGTAQPVDRVSRGGRVEAGPPSYQQMLAASVGRGAADTVDQGTVAAGRREAQAHQDVLVDWRNPAQTLNQLTQIDSDQGVQKGGDDQDRCGAAALVAGTVLLGPERLQQAARAVAARGTLLVDACHRMGAREALPKLQEAVNFLQELAQLPPDKLKVGDLHRMQQAVYVIANLDHNLATKSRNSGLSSWTLKDYRERMWGQDRPTLGGKPLDVFIVKTPSNGGHFVLADSHGRHDLAYNPWPQDDGTAYARGVDGPTRRGVNGHLIDKD